MTFSRQRLADRVLDCIERALETGAVSTLEYEIEIAGVRHWKESRMMPSGRARW